MQNGGIVNWKKVDILIDLSIEPLLAAFGISLYKLFLPHTAEYLKTISSFTRELYPELFK